MVRLVRSLRDGPWIFGRHERPAGSTCPYSWGRGTKPSDHRHMCGESAAHTGDHVCQVPGCNATKSP